MAAKVKLKPGDLVYRVVDVDLPSGTHTWEVATAKVVAASDRQITLEGGSRAGLRGKRFKPHSLGLIFFASEAGAIAHFIGGQRRAVESAQRAIEEAQRALMWAQTLRIAGISGESPL